MVREYRGILNCIFNDALIRANSRISARAIEQKAWEILGRPDIFRDRERTELELDQITKRINLLKVGDCDGTDSPYKIADQQTNEERTRLAWREIGQEHLYDEQLEIEKQIDALAEKLANVKERQKPFRKDRDDYRAGLKSFDVAIQALYDKREQLTWERLGMGELWAKRELLREQLGKVSTEEKQFNGNVCELRSGIEAHSYYRPRPPRTDTPLEEARWQAKELLYPEIEELKEANARANQELVLACVPERVGEIVTELREFVSKVLK